jgi:hypothetical protein
MARVAKINTTTKPTLTGRKPGRPAGAAAQAVGKEAASISAKRIAAVAEAPERRKPGRPPKTIVAAVLPKAVKATKAAARAPAAPPAPKVSKDELRAQVEKLEGLVAALRIKGREANKAAKAAAARISELEAQVAQLEEKVAAAPAPVQQQKPARAKRRGREIDPGDAAPPGVAVQEPAPLDEEAETALENLEEHLGHG